LGDGGAEGRAGARPIQSPRCAASCQVHTACPPLLPPPTAPPTLAQVLLHDTVAFKSLQASFVVMNAAEKQAAQIYRRWGVWGGSCGQGQLSLSKSGPAAASASGCVPSA
jgi:hypothetical protein